MPRQWATFPWQFINQMMCPAALPVPLLILQRNASVKTTIFQSSTFLLKAGNEIIDLISFSLLTAFKALERSLIVHSFSLVLNIKSEMRSFKSNENIHKKEGGSYYVVSANKASSVTLLSPGNESQRKHTAILRISNRQSIHRLI